MRITRVAIERGISVQSEGERFRRYRLGSFASKGEGIIVMTSVLCVDDDPEVGRTMQLVLEHGGYLAHLASNAADGAALLHKQRFDLMLLDCVPDRGWLAEEARRMYPNIRIALWTGHLDCAGDNPPWVDAVFHKPVPPIELLRGIADLLANPRVA